MGDTHCSGQTCYSDKGKRTRNKITGNQFLQKDIFRQHKLMSCLWIPSPLRDLVLSVIPFPLYTQSLSPLLPSPHFINTSLPTLSSPFYIQEAFLSSLLSFIAKFLRRVILHMLQSFPCFSLSLQPYLPSKHGH